MDLKNLTDLEIETNLEDLVVKERLGLTEILYHIKEVQDRKIYLKHAYPSLHAYCVEKLKYPGDQAYRRITAMKLLDECPELKEKLDQGSLNITQLGQASTYFSDLAKKDEPLTPQAKVDFLVSLSGKSTRDTEQMIAAVNPGAVKKDRIRPITAKLTEIRFVASNELMEKLNRFKDLDSHTLNHSTHAETLERLVDLALAQKENIILKNNQKTKKNSVISAPRKSAQVQTKSPPKKVVVNTLSRHIPTAIKREVYLRDEGKCTFENSKTGKRCDSRKRIQYDHTIPFSLGGIHSSENLTLRCQNHNLLTAEYQFGLTKMKSHLTRH